MMGDGKVFALLRVRVSRLKKAMSSNWCCCLYFGYLLGSALEMNNLVSAVMSLDCVMLCDVMVGNLTCIGLANLYIH